MANIIGLNDKKFVFFTFIFLFFALFVKAEGITSPNPLENFLQGLDTFSAGFEQILYDEFDEVLGKSVGVLYLQQPGKFHWAYWQPYSQFLISNGVTLWVYDEDLQQVIISDISESIISMPASILTGDADINEHYIFMPAGQSDGIEWIELTPKAMQLEYRAVNLGFRGDTLYAMKLFDNLGNKTQINFLDSKRNIALNDSLFELTPPEGVDVIDGRE